MKDRNLSLKPFSLAGLPWDAEALLPALWELLGRRTLRYTMADSSSVPRETAGELFESILFSIDLALASGAPSPESGNLDALLEFSWDVIEARLNEAKRLLHRAESSVPLAAAEAQNGTLEEIKAFFRRYDFRFFAHQIPCSVDYPLCLPVSENLRGVEYIREYLHRLTVENDFCLRPDQNAVLSLALYHCRDDLSMPVNLYGLTAANAIACGLLGEPAYALNVSDAGRKLLLRKFQNTSPEETPRLLRSSSLTVCRELKIQDPAQREYLADASAHLAPRVLAASEAGDLAGIFPSLPHETDPVPAPSVFIDNEPMDDEMLRELITVLSGCRRASEKVDLVLGTVHSLRDLVEILSVCFWKEELDPMLEAMDEDTLALLRGYVRQMGPDWQSASGWETRLNERELR